MKFLESHSSCLNLKSNDMFITNQVTLIFSKHAVICSLMNLTADCLTAQVLL